MNNGFTYNLGTLKVDQLGFVYKDIKKHARMLENTFGFHKFIFTGEKSHTFSYKGKQSEVVLNIGISRMGNTQIEFIQLIEGDCLYKYFLEQGKEGLQHFGTYVDNVQQAVEEFKKRGIEPIQTGRAVRHLTVYMDTIEYFGIYLELLELMRGKRRK